MGNIPLPAAYFMLLVWSVLFLVRVFPSWLPDAGLIRVLSNSVLSRHSPDAGFGWALAHHACVVAEAGLLHAFLVLSGLPAISWAARRRRSGFLESWGVGFGLAALMTAGWGLVGLLLPAPVFILSGLICAGAFIAGRRGLGPAFFARARGFLRLEPGFSVLLVSVLAGSAVILLLLAVAPDTSWDAVVYHLRLPSFFVLEHKIFHVPTHHFSAFPLNSEMLNSWLMLFGGSAVMGGGEAMKVFHLSCALISAFAARRLVLLVLESGGVGSDGLRGRSAAGWLAALLVVLCPVTGTISVRAYNDYAQAALAGLSLLAVAGGGPGSQLAAGWLCGTAFGVKYTALFFVIPIALLWWRTSPAPYLAAGAAFCPWVLKNYLLAGSPVSPMLSGLFPAGPETTGQLKAYAASVSSMAFDPAVLATAPWTLILSGEGETISELLPILLAAYLLFGGRRGPRESRIAWAVLGYFLLWGLIAPSIRFFAAVLAPLAALCALGFFRIEAVFGRPFRAVLAVLLLLNLARLPLAHLRLFDPLPFAVGRETLEDYETRLLYPSPYYGVMAREANARLPARARLLLMVDIKSHYFWRRAYHDFQYVTPGVYLKWLRIGGTVPGLLKKLRQEGVTHILVIPQGARGVGDHCSWRGDELALTAEFLSRNTRVLARAGEMELLEIMRKKAVRRPIDGYLWMLFRHPENLILAGENEEAAALLMETGNLAPWLAGCNSYLGMALGYAGRMKQAMPYLERGVREGGITAAYAANVAGMLNYRSGNWKGAEKFWRIALKLKPDFADAHYNLGVLFLKTGGRDEAVREMKEACRLAPGREEFAIVLKRVLEEEQP